MRKKYNILIVPGGSTIAQEIYYSLRDCKDINLFSINTNVPSHAPFIFKECSTMAPFSNLKKAITDINNACKKYRIDYIMPCNDIVLYHLSLLKNKLKSKLLISPHETVVTCRFKNITYDIFKNISPKIYSSGETLEYPCFIKPNIGSGGKDSYILKNKSDYDFYKNILGDNYVILEYLPGKEYTIDCFSDRDKGLLFCHGRQRTRISAGVAVNSISAAKIKQQGFRKIAKLINNKLVFHGAWFFQLKEDKNGNLKLLEVASRIGASTTFNRVTGINFPLLTIYEAERIPIKITTNQFKLEMDKCFVAKYRSNLKYKNVYIDLDDTLIYEDKVNPRVMAFIYQCINQDKCIYLITKHQPEHPRKILTKFFIDPFIFDDIICLEMDDVKARYIDESDSILIDDSFSERYPAHINNIPTFDLSMLEVLMDERV